MTAGMKRYRDSVELKIAAKESLDGRWLVAIAVCVVAWLLIDAFTYSNGGGSSIKFIMENGRFMRVEDRYSGLHNLMSIIGLIIGGPLYYGIASYFLKLAKREPVEFSELFSGFSLFKTNFFVNLLTLIFIWLWTMLLIVPGIIAGIKYSMAYYIVNENPEVGAMEAIRRSTEMMYGHKMRYFEMWLGFLGWFILGVATFGLGMIYAIPYFRAAKANFYLDLRENYNG